MVRREPAAGENGVILVSLLRREKQDAHIVSEDATSSGQEKNVGARDHGGATQRRRPADAAADSALPAGAPPA